MPSSEYNVHGGNAEVGLWARRTGISIEKHKGGPVDVCLWSHGNGVCGRRRIEMNCESVCCKRGSLAFAFQRLKDASDPFRRRSKKSRKPLFLLVYLPAPQVVSCQSRVQQTLRVPGVLLASQSSNVETAAAIRYMISFTIMQAKRCNQTTRCRDP
jgi:hypothetical protein